MKYLHAFLALLIAAISLPWIALAQSKTVEHYYGVGWQNDGSHWSIEVLLGDKTAQIVYPSLDCFGEWTLVSDTPEKLHFIETIVEGTENCVETGDIFLSPLPTGGYLYSWNEPGQTTAAKAILFAAVAGRLSYMEQLKVTLDRVNLDYMLLQFLE